MQVTLYVADRFTNALMKAADLCDHGKVYATPFFTEIERKGKDSTRKFLHRILAQPTTHLNYSIAAVSADGVIVARQGITQLSDGKHIFFVRQVRIGDDDGGF